MKTYMAKKGEVQAKWLLVDVTDKVLGRVAVRLARILMGKHHPEYTPHVDTGDFVVVINAEKIKITGGQGKRDKILFERFSGYPGGRRVTSLDTVLARKPEMVLKEAVRRMLPKTKLASKMLSKLKVYAGGDHPHQAQQPEILEL